MSLNNLLIILLTFLLSCGGKETPDPNPAEPEKEVTLNLSPASLDFSAKGESLNVRVEAKGDWSVTSNQSWCSTTPQSVHTGESILKVTVTGNPQTASRTAELTFTAGKKSEKFTVTQGGGSIGDFVPDGYSMVWQEEFNDTRLSGGKPALPNTEEWWYENLQKGAVNNELQTYVGGFRDKDTVAAIYDGTLKIMAKKIGDDILSARINTRKSWQYGYFEARLRVPGGKGIWPAFWMMPQNFKNWPEDGEIDIMEYVGYEPDVVHSTVHTGAYNHVKGTQKGARKSIVGAETEFHIYAVEWTADYIKGFVDGEEYFRFNNDGKGDKMTWPFNAPFYLKLNLAWGGDWGGAKGVDESALPATYEIDYVRVYQKK